MNDDVCRTYSANSQINFKAVLLKLNFCNYSDACTLVKKTLTVIGGEADNARGHADNINKQIRFKIFPTFTDYISEINNPEVDNGKDLDDAMSKYNLIKYNNNYTKITVYL